MDVLQITEVIPFVTLIAGMSGIFFGLRTQVKVLETQVERLEDRIEKMEERNETLLDELRNDIKDLLSNRA